MQGETLEEYWWCTEQMLTWPDGSGANLLVDDGGDATLLIHGRSIIVCRIPVFAVTFSNYSLFALLFPMILPQFLHPLPASSLTIGRGGCGALSSSILGRMLYCEPIHWCDCLRLLAEGVKAEAAYAKDKTLPDPTSTDNPEFQIVLTIIKEGLPKNPNRWTAMSKEMEGVSEETTTGVKRLYEMQVLTCLSLHFAHPILPYVAHF